MDSDKTEYQPLATSSDEGNDGPAVVKHFESRHRRERWGKITLGICLLAILISNGVWTAVYRRHKHIHELHESAFPVNYPYLFTSPYVDANTTEMNRLWKELFPPGNGAVKVDPQWAIDNHLQKTQGYSADGKAIYVVAAYHQLHCLTVIRTSLYQAHNGRKQLDDWDHVTHCLDTIRQAVRCLADPGLGGVGTERQCRDFDALREWVEEHAYTDFIDNP